MTKTVEIKCDACGADLTSTGNSIGWRLTLTPERKPSRGGFVTDMMIYPALDHEHHFCGMDCLDYWRDREKYRTSLLSKWHERWKKEHGTQHGPGSYSYPSPSDEVTKARNDEISEKVAQRFPMKRPDKRRPVADPGADGLKVKSE